MPIIDDLFREIDARWGAPPTARIRLRIIGSSALMLQTGYERGTKDSDVLETAEITADVKTRMLDLAGKGSTLHAKHRLFIDFVSRGTPFLPQTATYHLQAGLNAELRHFEIEVLDVVDVVVAKLKRFHAADRGDIEAMVERDLVPHAELVSRFRAAVNEFACDARAEELPRYVGEGNVRTSVSTSTPETADDVCVRRRRQPELDRQHAFAVRAEQEAVDVLDRAISSKQALADVIATSVGIARRKHAARHARRVAGHRTMD